MVDARLYPRNSSAWSKILPFSFAVATAQSKNSPLLTGDPEIKGLPGGRVIWLG